VSEHFVAAEVFETTTIGKFVYQFLSPVVKQTETDKHRPRKVFKRRGKP